MSRRCRENVDVVQKRKVANEESDDSDSDTENENNTSLNVKSSVTVKEKSEDDSEDEILSENDDEEDQQNSEDEEILVRLKNLEVNIGHEVPLLHSILNRSTRPTRKQVAKIRKKGLCVHTGKYNKLEDQQIRKNWKKFIKVHDLPDRPDLFFTLYRKGIYTIPKEELQKFLQFLARGLETRTLDSVYKRFKRLYRNETLTVGRFNEKEDETILKYLTEKKSRRAHSEIGKILKRDRGAIEKRIKVLFSENREQIVLWDLENIAIFLSHILEIIQCRDYVELKDHYITTDEWKKLSQELVHPVKYLQGAWFNTIYPKLFIQDTTDMIKLKKNLIQRLYENQENDWRKVDWTEYASYYEGFTPNKIYSIFKCIVYKHVPQKAQKNIKECLEYLHVRCTKEKFFRRWKLKRIVYENGVCVEEDEE